MYYFVCYNDVFDDFPKISDHFPKFSEDSPKIFRKLHEPFRTISEDKQSFPKITEDRRTLSPESRMWFRMNFTSGVFSS